MALLDYDGLTYVYKKILTRLSKKVDKVEGKDLSTNDFTDEYKIKLESLNPDAQKVTVDDALSTESVNPVQNKVITDKIIEVQSSIPDISGLATSQSLTDGLASKSSVGHTHTAEEVSADAKGSADAALSSAKSYTDIKTASLASTTVVDNKISTHNTSTSAHNDIRALITELTTKVNNFLDVDDETTDQLSEVITLIENNKGTLESLTTSKINVSDIVDNLTTSSTSKVLSAKQGVAIKALIDALQAELDSHTHVIADVSGLQTALDGKAASSHGTHVTFSTTAPAAAGTAAVGTATTVSRSDHVHPAQTTITGNAGTATALKTTRYIDGVSFNGGANVTRYATCSTAAATVAKTAAITAGTFSLITGARVTVKFTYANSAASPTLNVGSTGAKAIYWHGAALASSQYWQAGAVLDFVYNGSQWELVGVAKDNNTTYSSLKNPYALTINKTQGGAASSVVYDGSAAMSISFDDTAIWDKIDILSNYHNRKYIFLGDSYGAGTNLASGEKNWIQNTVELMELTDSDYFSSAVSGAGFIAGTTFLSQLNTLANSMTTAQKASITDIVILGGWNDRSSTFDAMMTAFGTFRTTAMSTFTNSDLVIHVGMVSWHSSLANTHHICTLENWYKSFPLHYKNVNYLTDIQYVMRIPNVGTMSSDSLHPNATGQLYIARSLKNCLLFGRTDLTLFENKPTIVYSNSSDGWYYEMWSNGIAKLWNKNSVSGVNITTNGNSEYHSISYTANFPITLTQILYVGEPTCFNGTNAWANVDLKIETVTTSSLTAHFNCDKTFSGLDITYGYHVIGKWR